ncbi:hypothetical protein GDO78_010398 [Eleutherodactylus coqui]|uniref:Autophagy related 2B n=1 Tax=Eleutherodactylus coqui TaxID=57060 RepID=A0A8J6F6C1_ELECQ|nr:hypothetical protein GDO78_010398 [Eleutherodactylus coqui]
MPWPFSESIKKRACRYLLQRYLGHFLQEKLSLEQLTLDLYQGTGTLSQVPLDKWSLNEIMESADAPLEVTEGFIQTISLSVPWGSLLQDNCALEVKGLEVVFRPRPRPRSVSEPMYWSSFMTSSMQLARECLSQKLTDEQESSQPFEGLEKFAETIETVLRRVRVTFIDTVFRIENIPENSKTGCALEIRISRTVYSDETVDEQSGINVHRPSAFAHKVLELSGVSFFWDEFPASARTSPVSSTLHVLDVDGRVDSFHVFLSPRQVHLLLDMLSSIAGPETSGRLDRSRKDKKSRPMQQEDELRLQMELKRYLRKEDLSGGASAEHSFYETDTAKTPSSHDEEVFFSMADMDMSHSLSSLPPLGDPPTVDLDLSLTSTYNNSPVGSPLGGTAAGWSDYQEHSRLEEPTVRGASFKPNMHQNSLRRTSLPNRSVSLDDSRPELVFRLAVGSLSASVLHIDPLPPTESTSSPNPLTPLSLSFFNRIETLEPQTFAQNDFAFLRNVFAEACTHDHLRFIGVQIKISHEQRQRSGSRCYSTDVCIGQTELLECLFPSDLQPVPPQYTELLKFTVDKDPDCRSSPCVHLHYKHSENRGAQGSSGRLSSLPQRSELHVQLSSASCELDVTIVDRLNSLLQVQKLGTVEMMTSHLFTSYNKHISLHKDFPEVLLDDSRSPANTRTSVLVSAPSLHLAVRFPIPDLRSDQERGPWFKKSLQKEVLHLNFSDVEFKTEVLGGCSPEQLKLEFTFKELTGAFQEESDGPQIQFLRVVKKNNEVDGDMTTSDNFDWPRIVLRINPIAVHSILERVSAEEDDEVDGRFQEDDEGTSHSLKDVCDFRRPEPSPFSSRRVMFENEEMVMPGDAIEMTEFQEKAISNSHYVLELTLPSVYLMLPNKVFYEKLYNRISNDLLLWEPTAPSPVETFENLSYGIGLSVASQLINTFSKDSSGAFKSTLHYDDDSGSEEETLQYDYILDSNYHSRRKKKLECPSKQSQSFLSVLVNINHGLASLFTDVKSDGKLMEGKHGEFWLEFNSGSLFTVTKYEGFEDKHFLCLHASSLSLYHQGVLDGVVVPSDLRLPSLPQPHWLEPTIYSSGEDGCHRASSNGVGMDTMSMLTMAVKIQSDKTDSNTKEFLVAVGLRGATLKHRVLQSEHTWHEQILQFLNISDEPVLGYSPPTSITTFHVHLWSCALDYRPLYLPIRALLTVETFSISCSVALDKSSSSLRIILDEAALHLSDKCNAVSVNLSRDYVRVLDMGLLELTILAVKFGEENKPRFEMYCSSDVIHIRTCSDSCAALMNLIQYIASYGDLHPPTRTQASSSTPKQAKKTDTSTGSSSRGPMLAEEEQQILRDLMSDAMEDTDIYQDAMPAKSQLNGVSESKSELLKAPCSDLFLFPDESGTISEESSPTFMTATPHLISEAILDAPLESDDFCILYAPKTPVSDKDEEPSVKKLVNDAISIKENYFSSPGRKSDTSKAPLHFPVPVFRYVVKEVSLVWHLYGGKDLGSAASCNSPAKHYTSPHSSPSSTPTRRTSSAVRGGRGRNQDLLMEIQLTKLTVKALHVRPESSHSPQECCLRVTLMPLRLNIDQRPPGSDVTCTLPKHLNPQERIPVISFLGQNQPVRNGDVNFAEFGDDFMSDVSSFDDQPIFFREFRFTSEVPIRLDYHGKHVSMDQGTFTGILIGLAQLNNSELKLKRLCYRHGLLGVDKLFSYAINEWLTDIKKNQLPGILGGVGPMHSLVQLVQGLKDLVWLPIEQYYKDGRIVRGFQRGAASFGTSTAMAALELTNRVVQTIQAAAETAYDMVSPGPSPVELRRAKRFSHHRLVHQPVDLREGVAKAYTVVKEGITDTAQTIYETAAREHENRGVTGAVGGVLRQIPPAVVKPLIVATEATSNVLGGMRNQIRPDVREEESQKWRLEEG